MNHISICFPLTLTESKMRELLHRSSDLIDHEILYIDQPTRFLKYVDNVGCAAAVYTVHFRRRDWEPFPPDPIRVEFWRDNFDPKQIHFTVLK